MTNETRTQFDYLLNAFEHASQHDQPATQGYATKRAALLAYVREAERDAARWRAVRDRAVVISGSCSTIAELSVKSIDTAPRASSVIIVPDDFADAHRSLCLPPSDPRPPEAAGV